MSTNPGAGGAGISGGGSGSYGRPSSIPKYRHSAAAAAAAASASAASVNSNGSPDGGGTSHPGGEGFEVEAVEVTNSAANSSASRGTNRVASIVGTMNASGQNGVGGAGTGTGSSSNPYSGGYRLGGSGGSGVNKPSQHAQHTHQQSQPPPVEIDASTSPYAVQTKTTNVTSNGSSAPAASTGRGGYAAGAVSRTAAPSRINTTSSSAAPDATLSPSSIHTASTLSPNSVQHTTVTATPTYQQVGLGRGPIGSSGSTASYDRRTQTTSHRGLETPNLGVTNSSSSSNSRSAAGISNGGGVLGASPRSSPQDSPTKALQTQLSSHLTTLQSTQTNSLESAFQLLLSNIATHTKQLSELSSAQRSIQSELGVHQNELMSHKNELVSNKEELNERMEQDTREQEGVREEIDLVYEKWSDLNGVVTNLERGVEGLSRDLNDIRGQVGGGQVDGLKGAVDALNGELVAAQRSIEGGDANMGQLRDLVNDVSGKLDGLENTTAELQEAARTTAAKMAELEQVAMDTITKQELNATQQLEKIRAMVDGTIKTNEVLAVQLNNLASERKDEVERWERDRAEEKARNDDLVKRLEQSEAEGQLARAALEEMEARVQSQLAQQEEKLVQMLQNGLEQNATETTAAIAQTTDTQAAMEAALESRFEDVTARCSTLTDQSVSNLQVQLEAQRQSDASVINARFDDIVSALPDFGTMATLLDVHSVRDEVVGEMDGVRGVMEGTVEGKVDELKGQMDGVKSDLAKTSDNVHELNGTVAQLKEEASGTSSTVATIVRLNLETELSQMKDATAQNARDVTDLNMNLTQLSDRTMGDAADGLRARVERVESSLPAMADDVTVLRCNVDTVKTDVETVKLDIRTVSAGCETAQVQGRDLSDRMDEMVKVNMELTEANASRDEFMGRVGRDVEGLRLVDRERVKKESERESVVDGALDEVRDKMTTLESELTTRVRELDGALRDEMTRSMEERDKQREGRDASTEEGLAKARQDLTKLGRDANDLRLLDHKRSQQLVELKAGTEAAAAARDEWMESTKAQLESVQSELAGLTEQTRERDEKRAEEMGRVHQDLEVLRLMDDEQKRTFRDGLDGELGGLRGDLDDMRRRVDESTAALERERLAAAANSDNGGTLDKNEIDAMRVRWETELNAVRGEMNELRRVHGDQAAVVGGIRREVEGMRVREKTRELKQFGRAPVVAGSGSGSGTGTGIPATPSSVERGMAVSPMQPSPSTERGLPSPQVEQAPTVDVPPADRSLPTVVPRSTTFPPAAAIAHEEEDQATVASAGDAVFANAAVDERQQQPGGDQEPTDQIAMALDGLRKLQESLLKERTSSPTRSIQGGSPSHKGFPSSSSGVEERLAARKAARSAENSPVAKGTPDHLQESRTQQLEMHKAHIERQHHEQLHQNHEDQHHRQQHVVASATSATGEEQSTEAPGGPVAAPNEATNAEDAVMARQDIGDSLASRNAQHHNVSTASGTDPPNSSCTPTIHEDSRKAVDFSTDTPGSTNSTDSKQSKVSDITPVRRAREEVANLEKDLRGWEEDLAVADGNANATTPVRRQVDPLSDSSDNDNNVRYTPAEINRTRAAAREAAAAALEEAVTENSPDDSVSFSAASGGAFSAATDGAVVISPDRGSSTTLHNMGAPGHTPAPSWQRDVVDDMARQRLRDGDGDGDNGPRGAPNFAEEHQHQVGTPPQDSTAPNVSRSRTLAFRDMVSRGSFERKQQQQSQQAQQQRVTFEQGAPTPDKPRDISNTDPTPAKPRGHRTVYSDDDYQGSDEGQKSGARAPDPPSEENADGWGNSIDDQQRKRVVHDPPDDMRASVAVLGQKQLQKLQQQQQILEPQQQPQQQHVSIPVVAPPAPTHVAVNEPSVEEGQQHLAPVANPPPIAAAPAPEAVSSSLTAAESDPNTSAESHASRPHDEAAASSPSRVFGPTTTLTDIALASVAAATEDVENDEQQPPTSPNSKNKVVVVKEVTKSSQVKSRHQFYTPSTANFTSTGAVEEKVEFTSFAARKAAVEAMGRKDYPAKSTAKVKGLAIDTIAESNQDDDDVPPPPPSHSYGTNPPQAATGQERQTEEATDGRNSADVHEEDEMAILPPRPRGGFGLANSDDVASMRSRASSDQSAHTAEDQLQQEEKQSVHSARESIEQQIEQRRKDRILAKAAADEKNKARQQHGPAPASPSTRGAAVRAPVRHSSPTKALPPSPRDEQQRLVRRQVAQKQRQQKSTSSPPSRHRTIVEEAIEFARQNREAEKAGSTTAAPGAHRQQQQKRGASFEDHVRNAAQQNNRSSSHKRWEREPSTTTRHQQGRNARGHGEDSTTPRMTANGQSPGKTTVITTPRDNDVSMVVTDDEEEGRNGRRRDMENSILSDEMDEGIIRMNPATATDDFEDRLAMNNARAISPINTAPSQLPQQPVLQAIGQKPEGCYLVYFSDSGGKLILHYSRTPIPNAIGFWAAGHDKSIQGFKFRQNSGRVELIKGIAGGDANKRKYFSGWCQFVKAAVAFKGSVRKFPNVGGLEVDIYAHSPDGTTHYLSLDEETIDVSEFDAIACIPKHNNLFNGVKALDLNRFVNTANIAGAALPL